MDSSRCPGWYRQQGLFLHKGEVPTVYADKPEAGLPDSPHSRGDPLPRRRLIELHAKDRWTDATRSEEHTSELQSLMRISYAVFCLKKKNIQIKTTNTNQTTQIRT